MSHSPKKSGGFVHAHQFESPEQQYQASTLGMWLFLITEIMFFGGLFLVYAVYRSQYPEAFRLASHHLDIGLGAFNTAALLGSSFTMVMAVYAAQTSRKNLQVFYLLLTIVLGAVFLGVKGMEYAHKFHEHLVPGPHFHFPEASREAQLFFSLYFAMTGMHAVHMIIGLGLLVYLVVRGARGAFNREYCTPVEMIGLYWHFVDIVWIFLFPLLYLIGRHA